VVEGDGHLIGIVAFDDIVELLAKELAGVALLSSRAERREERRGPGAASIERVLRSRR
jgi:Mg/Co/Ni transporter MgtE